MQEGQLILELSPLAKSSRQILTVTYRTGISNNTRNFVCLILYVVDPYLWFILK